MPREAAVRAVGGVRATVSGAPVGGKGGVSQRCIVFVRLSIWSLLRNRDREDISVQLTALVLNLQGTLRHIYGQIYLPRGVGGVDSYLLLRGVA